jgi:outer membrane receptor protein involved in Fe transport
LFGAGSQGGTVRFITPSPSLGALESYSRAEIAASGFARRDGGFVDRVPYPDGNGANPSRGFPEKDSNSVETYSGRVALTWQATENLSITPSVFYQDLQSNGTSQYWIRVGETPISNVEDGEYLNGDKIASTNEDKFTLPSLKIRWDVGKVTIASDTSYLRRRESGIYDYGAFINNIFGFGSDPTPTLSIPGNYDVGHLSNSQNNVTQEFRINSNDPNAAVTYVVGAFWTRAKQESHQDIVNPFFESIVGMPVEFFYGLPRAPGGFIYVDNFSTTDEQIAAFGEVNWELVQGLKLTAGLRIAKTELEFRTTRDGPAQGGPGADEGKQEEEPVTPKLGVSYQINDAHMVYATAAKGFRIGGVNRGIPTNATCDEDLAAIGLSSAPLTYDSDTVWSYEAGSKNRLAGGAIRLATSVYYIKWKDIVNSVSLPNCGFSFTDNLGSATIKGFDLEAELQPIDSLTLGLAVGYNKGTYDETIESGGPKNLVTAGYTTGGNPWVVSASGQYDFAIAGLDSYFRVDYSYRSQNTWLTDTTDPNSPDYDPLVPRNPTIKDLRLRAGIRFNALDLSAFVNNATNERYLLNVDHVTQYGQIFTATAVRPITYGVTATYRF